MTYIEFKLAWDVTFPGLPIHSSSLKEYYADHFVRFHNLPDSKQWPTNENEEDILIHRQMMLLNETFPEKKYYLVLPCFERQTLKNVYGSYIDLVNVSSSNKLFLEDVIPEIFDDGDSCEYYIAIKEKSDFDDLKRLLIAVSYDKINHPVFVNFDHGTIISLYDGGVDLIINDSHLRNKLRKKCKNWLPKKGLPFSIN